MRRYLVVSLALVAMMTAPATGLAPAAAQVSPADSAAVLLVAARRLAQEGDAEVSQAVLRFLIREFPGTPAAAQARAQLGDLAATGAGAGGRVELRVWSTLYGLWLGVAVPGALGVDGPEPYGVGLLAGGPAGFLAGKAIAGSRDLTVGQARAITLGGTWGTWQGYGWAEVLDLGGHEVCWDDGFGEYCYEEDIGDEERFAGMIVGGLAGIAAGAVLSRRSITPGVATAANFGALWGSWLGFGAGYLGDLDGDALLAATLLGGNAGLGTTAVLAPGWNVSRSRARLVSIYGVIGGLAGLGLDLVAQPDDEKVAVGIALAGSVVGLALGVGATRDLDRTGSEVGSPEAHGGAFLNVSDGGWSVGAPLPTPRLLDLDHPGGARRKLALGVPLLRVRF